MSEQAPSVLVIGAGMYVGGRGAGTDGTILPTLIEAQGKGLIGDIAVAATSRDSIDMLQAKLEELNSRLGTHVRFEGYPSGNGRWLISQGLHVQLCRCLTIFTLQ